MIRTQQSLQALNTLRCPAMADHYAELGQASELAALLAAVRDAQWPVTVLGEGSNVVLGDTLSGLVLVQRCRGIELLEATSEVVRLRVAAGENWHELVRWCLERGYHGLENLALIPGTVGAAPIQNIGAYGVEVDRFIEQVDAVELPGGAPLVLDRDACGFGYRDSVFKHALRDRALIMTVTFALPQGRAPVTHYPSLQQALQQRGIDRPGHRDVFDTVVSIRESRLPDPAVVPNAGSFFKNPVLPNAQAAQLLSRWPALPHYPGDDETKLPAAWLIEQCGFKQRQDAVRVHAQHALVITNPEHKSAVEVAALAAEIRSAVAAKFGILLEQEPCSYGLEK